NGKMNVPRLYLHRYLRLTPILGFLVLFDPSLLKFLGSGPIWPLLVKPTSICGSYWWSALFYIQNYVQPGCYAYAWYLSVDMQLFLIAPALVYLIYKFKVKIMPILILLIVGCVGCTVAIFLKYGIKRRYPLQQIDSTGTTLEYALYDALGRVAWSVALCYIVFACMNKCGGGVNWFLSHRLWLPLSRLSYSIYLIHYHVLLVIMGATKTAPVFTEWIL
ncbi:nose resistant to fluoxetine protein 6-like, partial [Sitodiplosis mosellana]|uniref:nose resistant to fluoxetine protein 6-like n=1 Tax=Sitodiplosis mosellana TaxID=263140 RepID=UPI0024445410